MTGIILDSDYRDYYDSALNAIDLPGELTLSRRRDSRLDRASRFEFLTKMGLKTPLYGKVKELIPELLTRDQILTDCPGLEDVFEVIVYFPGEDENKVRVTYREAIEQYPEHFAAEYIPTSPAGFGVCWEYVCIGMRPFWLQHASSDNWQANKGTTRVRLSVVEKQRPMFEETMLVDCVFSTKFIVLRNRMVAINYHTSPILKGTPVQNVMDSGEAAESIYEWYRLNHLKLGVSAA
tara:strand:- start:198 stop:905 length:708 start_codon:yes stop_codon:yes gene_type:complete